MCLPRPIQLANLALAILVGSWVACRQHPREQLVMSDVQVRQLATQYRDQWLAKNTTEDAAQLAQGAIESVERSAGGWHVTFATPTGGGRGMEEGLHTYFLHVYLTSSGEIDKVIRGPDALS